jgi:YHS domain-containing protein
MAAFSVKSKKSGKTYYLHTKDVKLAGNRKQTIYYFAGKAEKNSLDELPTGYEVMENARTGLPMLRKKKKK